ncbi:hypothetical protein GHK33_05245 [Sinorhizobium meliloti]|uniref:hypothetical protein n=1 Tax=Rhizobium meliloti TaxID=382 RepID=UPI001295FFD7|nr:hypothetical protein [Sinorhizobium meliloti]MQW59611.1 hypothetical protein [Sinorhizobium meliloti]MQW62098.1 hypothetical protein [Sinorhizobium meliloti]
MARSGLISAIERLQIRVADLFESGNIVFLGLVALSAPLVGFPLKLVFSAFHFHKAVTSAVSSKRKPRYRVRLRRWE